MYRSLILKKNEKESTKKMIIAILLIVTILLIVGCIKTKKKAIKACFGIFALISILITILGGSFIYIVDYKLHDIDSKISPDGTYNIMLQQVGDPDFPFGSTYARVVLKNGKNIIIKYKFDVQNDGANISKESWRVEWNEDSVDCVVYGEEQSDQLYRIYYDGQVEHSALETHYGVF